ncbi:MAG: hypothetical protein ABIT10_09280 [Alteraurantiacibacter sp.]
MTSRNLAAALAVFMVLCAPSVASAQDCDRACLGGLVTQYIDALLAHDASTLPLAEGVRVTEDGNPAQLGQGLWQSVTGKGTFRHDYLDVERQVAAAQVHFLEDDTPVLLAFALHVENGRIAGIETIVHHVTPDSPFQPTVLGEPVRGMDTPVPADLHMSRADMVAVALRYAEGLRTGSFIDANVPFAPETYRVENGVITAGQGCRGAECGLTRQRIMVHPGLVPSVVAVDEENGTVLLWMNFGYTGSYGQDRVLVTFEAFKVWGGSVHAIAAFFDFLPIGTPRMWPSEEPVRGLY